MSGHDFLESMILEDEVDDLRADLAESEDRYLAAELELELLQRVVWKATNAVFYDEHWVWEPASWVEVTEDEADAINRALDACS